MIHDERDPTPGTGGAPAHPPQRDPAGPSSSEAGEPPGSDRSDPGEPPRPAQQPPGANPPEGWGAPGGWGPPPGQPPPGGPGPGPPGGWGPGWGPPGGWGPAGPGGPGWGQAGGWGSEPPTRRGIEHVFQDALRLYRRHFLLLIGFTGLLQLPLILLAVPFQAYQHDLNMRLSAGFTFDPDAPGPGTAAFGGSLLPGDLTLLMALSLSFVLVASLLGTFALAAGAYIVGRARRGDSPTGREVTQALTRLAGAIVRFVLVELGIFLATGVALFGAVVLLAVGVVLLAGSSPESLVIAIPLVFLAFVAGLIVMIAVMVRLTVGVPALVHERRGAIAALRRSWELVRGRMWRTFAIVLLVGLALGAVSAVVGIVLLPGYYEGVLRGDVGAYLVATLLTGGVQLVLGPIFPAVVTVLYFDLVEEPRGVAWR